MNIDLKNSPTTLQRRVSDRTMKVCLAVLAGLGVIALPLRADAAGAHPERCAVTGAPKQSLDSGGDGRRGGCGNHRDRAAQLETR